MTTKTKTAPLDAITVYRALHPGSRATGHFTASGSSGAVRRATCVYCREVVATCSAKWKPTKTYQREQDEHECAERAHYEAVAAWLSAREMTADADDIRVAQDALGGAL